MNNIRQSAVIIFFFSLLLLGFSVWQVSPWSFHNFDTICQNFNYYDCMQVFYQQKSYFKVLFFIMGAVAGISGISSLYFLLIKKKTEKIIKKTEKKRRK